MSDHSVYSPSSASIWLRCPASAHVSQLYGDDNIFAFLDENAEYSTLGTEAHALLEDALNFDTPVVHDDVEVWEGVELAVFYAHELLRQYPESRLYVEKRFIVPEHTEIWGTTDIAVISPKVLHIVDFKFGWLPVNVKQNEQLGEYLLGAIGEFGEREEYYITIIQPRYAHEDGPIRTYRVTEFDIHDLRTRNDYALSNRGVFKAGKHCRHCKANGSCEVVAEWLIPYLNTAMEYEITNRHAITDEKLAELLDMLDVVKGWTSGVRQEAFRRALNTREIGGYKIVKGKAERKVTNEAYIKQKYDEWGIPTDALYEASLVSPLTIEKQLKATFRGHGRGVWKKYYDQLEPAIGLEFGSMSLVRATDARPRFNKGDEFGDIPDKGDILI